MKKYTVHLYEEFVVKVQGIEAESQEAAIEYARTNTPLSSCKITLCGHDGYWLETSHGCLVDEEGDEDFRKSRCYCEDDVKAIEAKIRREKKS